jgi:predicted RNA-binding Zn-ribbon protein involved in translation (DUF1610 family)
MRDLQRTYEAFQFACPACGTAATVVGPTLADVGRRT